MVSVPFVMFNLICQGKLSKLVKAIQALNSNEIPTWISSSPE